MGQRSMSLTSPEQPDDQWEQQRQQAQQQQAQQQQQQQQKEADRQSQQCIPHKQQLTQRCQNSQDTEKPTTTTATAAIRIKTWPPLPPPLSQSQCKRTDARTTKAIITKSQPTQSKTETAPLPAQSPSLAPPSSSSSPSPSPSSSGFPPLALSTPAGASAEEATVGGPKAGSHKWPTWLSFAGNRHFRLSPTVETTTTPRPPAKSIRKPSKDNRGICWRLTATLLLAFVGLVGWTDGGCSSSSSSSSSRNSIVSLQVSNGIRTVVFSSTSTITSTSSAVLLLLAMSAGLTFNGASSVVAAPGIQLRSTHRSRSSTYLPPGPTFGVGDVADLDENAPERPPTQDAGDIGDVGDIGYAGFGDDDPENEMDAIVDSNAEQLYQLYKRAQEQLQQQQQQQQEQEQQHHHSQREAPALSMPSGASQIPLEDFDEMLAGSASSGFVQTAKRSATRRSATSTDSETMATMTPTTTTTTTPLKGTFSEILMPTATAKHSQIPIAPPTSIPKPSPAAAAAAAAIVPAAAAVLGNGAKIAVAAASTGTTTTTPTTQKPTIRKSTKTAKSEGGDDELCEPKVLAEVPTEPYYDFTDIAEDAARQFTEFLSSKFPPSTGPSSTVLNDQLREEVRRRATAIASYALNEDENLLAFAIAAPSVHTVVVKFRDNVTVPPDQVHNKSFLGAYWRVLGAAWNTTDGTQEWGAPFRDCNLMKGRWLWPFGISYADQRTRIAAAAFIAADEDVCNDGLEEVFGRRHGCDRNTTFCLLTENKPAATRDVYTCICREGFYLPNVTLQGFRGDLVEMSEGFDNYSCVPCPGGCFSCDQNGVCLLGEPQEVVSMESLLKVSMGTVLGTCILCCIVLCITVFRQRKCKAIASGMWTILETILFGILLLYASVAVHFFGASTERCLLEPWLRELGFITCYGAIILKLYRHLVDFRTRKAHRWVLRDVDLLKYLSTMVFAVICYMAAYTASALDLLQTADLETLRELRTDTCLPLKWEFVTQASEVLILCFGLHLSFASRNANTQFKERQFLVATLVLEFLVSTSFYVLRFVYLPEMSPSAIFLALFLRSQLTNTIALGLIFVPKLWYQHKQGTTGHDAGQRLGGGYGGLCLGDPDIGELTISEMSPEDIRAELKRLYTQLEILKNKSLRQDNPHISKRRGGRKAGHRRFSLQKKGSKDKALSAKHRSNKNHQDVEITEAEPSRTPEDSVCSVEGPTDTYAEISGISHSVLTHSMVSHSVVTHSK